MRALLMMVSFLLLPAVALAQNQPPVADAGEDQTVFVGDFVQLDGTGSFDPDGVIVLWVWELDSIPPTSGAGIANPFSATPAFTPDVAGQYVLSLVVSDGVDQSDPDTVSVTVSVNQPPVAIGSANRTQGSAPLTIRADGSASFDPDGEPLYHRWSFGDGSLPVEAAIVTHTYDRPGSYEAILTVAVVGDNSQVDTDSITVTVTEPTVPSMHPIALYVLLPGLLAGAGLVAMRG